MPEAGWLLAGSLLATVAGFGLLALSQDGPRRRVAECAPLTGGTRFGCRFAAVALFGVSLALSLFRDGPSFGAVAWVAQLSLCALVVVALLAARPVWLRVLTRRMGRTYSAE